MTNKKRVIVIHGFQGQPGTGWKPWIGKALEFHKQLGGKFITENGMGHFSSGEGITKVPTALRELLQI